MGIELLYGKLKQRRQVVITNYQSNPPSCSGAVVIYHYGNNLKVNLKYLYIFFNREVSDVSSTSLYRNTGRRTVWSLPYSKQTSCDVQT